MARPESGLLHVGFMSNITWLHLTMHYDVGMQYGMQYAGKDLEPVPG